MKNNLMNKLHDKYGNWALITGASSGIGRSFAETLAQEGFNLVLIARNEVKLLELSKILMNRYSVNCRIIAKDLSDESAVPEIVRETAGLEIGLLINNAGYALTGEFITGDLVAQTKMMKINSLVPMQLCHHFGEKMVARGKGGIINVASVSGLMPLPGWATYAAAKAFMVSFSASLWFEFRNKGVDVLALCPGAVKTDFHQRANIISTGLNPEEVVKDGLRNLGRKPSAITGINNQVMAFIMQLMPARLKIKIGAMAIQKMKGP